VPQSFNAGLTYYQQTAANNCGMPWPSSGAPQSGATMYTAISTNLYDDPSGSGSCGKCVQVNGKTLIVVDQCPNNAMNPSCAQDHLDLGGQATYTAVQGSTAGSVPNSPGVAVKFVPCPVTGNLEYSFSTSTQTYYLAMVVLNAKYGIKSVAYRATGATSWTQMPARTDGDAHWIINGTTVPNPIDLQVTDEWGQVIEDTNLKWVAGQVVNGSYQFPTCP
jgi:expansin (peptidoglycan-binding protein)